MDPEPLTLEHDFWLRERAPHDLEPFREPRVALVHRNAEAAELERAESWPHSHHHPSFAEVIDPTDLFGQPQRMVQRHDRDPVADADPLRPLRDSRRIDRRHPDQAESCEVVLGHPNALEAVPLREIDFPQRLLDDLAVRRGAPAREKLGDADVHHGCTFTFTRSSEIQASKAFNSSAAIPPRRVPWAIASGRSGK